jgi:hypothetical protein
MTTAELINAIFDGQTPYWRQEFEQWVKVSRRFRGFAETYRDKIRKKLRNVRDDAGFRDLYCELETAYCLVQGQRFTVEYEKYAVLKQRSPDFTVAFRVNTFFNVEVTRIRSLAATQNHNSPEISNLRKVSESIYDKLGQMPPSIINVLLLVSEIPIEETEFIKLLTALPQQVRNNPEAFFTRYGFRDAADLLKYFRHVSAIICRGQGLEIPIFWLNQQTKHQLPKDLQNALKKTFS